MSLKLLSKPSNRYVYVEGLALVPSSSAAQRRHPPSFIIQVGLKHQTEAERAAQLRAKKEAKEREDAELRLLFSQLQAGAGKKAKAMEAAEAVS